MKQEKNHCKKRIHRSDVEKIDYSKRLNRIEGQVRGIKKMVEEDRHCDEILIQISAIAKALKSLGWEVLENHMRTCMVEDIQKEELETIDEVLYYFRRLV